VCSPRMHERIIILGDDDDGPEFNAIRWSERNEASPKPAALAAAWAGTAALFVAAVHHGGGVGDDLRHGVLDRLLLPPRRRLRHTNQPKQQQLDHR